MNDNVTDYVASIAENASQMCMPHHEDGDIDQKVVDLCKRYLTGSWSKVDLADVTIERMVGGVGSRLYKCQKGSLDNEEQCVIVRLHGHQYPILPSKFERAITSVMLSERGIGPKVLGVFHQGQIMKFYKCRNFNENDLYNADLRDKLADKIAMLHYTDVPVNRNNYSEFFLNYFLNKIDDQFIVDKRIMCEKYGCEAINQLNMKAEVQWLLNTMHTFDSPIVFGQQDFRFGNTLITENNDLFLCDFDICGYNYRGFDFAWLLIWSLVDPNANAFRVKDPSVVKQFIASYIASCKRIVGKSYEEDPRNTVEHIYDEINKFFLVVTHFILLWAVIEEFKIQVPIDEQTYMLASNGIVTKYLVSKAELFEQN